MTTGRVIVVGAGPTGLMLACELALGGATPIVLERRAADPNITRAFAVHARTLELLDARGLADQLVPRGIQVRELSPAPGAVLHLDELPSRYGMMLIAPQSGTERVLEKRAEELGVQIVRGAVVLGLDSDADGVTVTLGDGTVERADYVVGCDGAHSIVRDLIGVDFVGKRYETHILLADVKLERPPVDTLYGRNNGDGVVLLVPFGDGWVRAIAWDKTREQAPLAEPVTEDEVRDAFLRIAGDDFGMHEMRWSSRFLSERKQARHYRVGRVFLAGDAAHVHSPLGGQGMNTGIGDAMNLGWKLAAVSSAADPEALLDTYEAERHPVGEQVLKLTDGFNQLMLGRSALRRRLQTLAVRAIVAVPRTRRFMRERLSQIGIGYPGPRGAHPMVGRRMPDTDCGGRRLYELLRGGSFVAVASDGVQLDRPDVVCGRHTDPALPAAVLVRPDGYVAWASDRPVDADALSAALDGWRVAVTSRNASAPRG